MSQELDESNFITLWSYCECEIIASWKFLNDRLSDEPDDDLLFINLITLSRTQTHNTHNFPGNVIDSIVNGVFNRTGLASDFENFVAVITRRKYRRS
jgi:hypothetical protein